MGIVPKHFFIIDQNTSKEHIESKLHILKRIPCRGEFMKI